MLIEVLFVSTGIAVYSWWRARVEARRRVTDAWREALQTRDWPRLEELARTLLPHARDPIGKARLRFVIATALLNQDKAAEAAAEMDPQLAPALPPRELALWHNNRGYALALSGRLDEADDELECAEIIVGDDDELEGRFTYTCVLGNRGIVRLRRGELAEAEALIEQAHATTQKLLAIAPAESPQARESVEWHAERFYWLAEAAQRRGDAALARTRLEESARLEGTRFGAKARKALAQ